MVQENNPSKILRRRSSQRREKPNDVTHERRYHRADESSNEDSQPIIDTAQDNSRHRSQSNGKYFERAKGEVWVKSARTHTPITTQRHSENRRIPKAIVTNEHSISDLDQKDKIVPVSIEKGSAADAKSNSTIESVCKPSSNLDHLRKEDPQTAVTDSKDMNTDVEHSPLPKPHMVSTILIAIAFLFVCHISCMLVTAVVAYNVGIWRCQYIRKR